MKNYKVWQKAVDLAVKVYEITTRDPLNKDFGLRDQMRRSSVSISSNIAEVDQLDSDKSSSDTFGLQRGRLQNCTLSQLFQTE